ncbi:MAG: cytochrome c3 family protein [Myxococcota bacterium]
MTRRRRRRPRTEGVSAAAALLWLACAFAAAVAVLVGPPTPARADGPLPQAKGPKVATNPTATSRPLPSPSASPRAAPTAMTSARPRRHGLSNLHGDVAVPLGWMPPGTGASPVPSEEIYPPQTITIRFNHQLHVERLGRSCISCHEAARESDDSADRILPAPRTCDGCHGTDHTDLLSVRAGEGPIGACGYCHLGQNAGHGGRVARTVLPPPNLKFSHRAHYRRNIGCGHCHGNVEKLELATRQQLPRMAGCFTCHASPTSARGQAKGACTTCHLTRPGGRMAVSFSTGPLLPPMWLHGAAHTPDFLVRHKTVAGANSALCGSCHEASFCTDCHDGRIRPRDVHPSDYISLHAVEAQQAASACVSCHQSQSFCADCHRRVGVARDAPSARRLAGRRFHPPPAEFTTAPRGPRHHAWEAQRNLNACVSCHAERDCVTCHASKGVRGGAGVNPHPLGFAARCGGPFRRNPRPCLVCHTENAPVLSSCR